MPTVATIAPTSNGAAAPPKKKDARAMFGGIAKEPAKGKKPRLDFPEELPQAVDLLAKMRQAFELEREINGRRAEVQSIVDRWYRDQLAKGVDESSVHLGALRITYQDRYKTIPIHQQDALEAILGEQFDRYFHQAASLSIKKEFLDDLDKMAALNDELKAALGEDRFNQLFDAKLFVAPVKGFAKRRWLELSPDANMKLDLQSLGQYVSFTDEDKNKAA